MLMLVTGGAASGKSEYAERAALALGGRPVYLATLRDDGGESRGRVARHRALRDGKGFETLERPLALADAAVPPGSTVLLECLTTLVANELFDEAGAGEAVEEAVRRGIDALLARGRNLVVVTNTLDRDGRSHGGGTGRYLSALSSIEGDLARRADAVVEVVCGIPLAVKGAPL